MSNIRSTIQQPRFREWLRRMPLSAGRISTELRPFLISLTVHCILFVLMAFWVLPLLSNGTDSTVIEARLLPNNRDAADYMTHEVDFSATNHDRSTLSQFQATVAAEIPAAPIGGESVPVDSPAMPSSQVKVRRGDLQPVTKMTDAELMQDLKLGVRAMAIHGHRGETRVEEADTPTGIASTLEGDLLSIAKDGDAMVVWVLDQSLSMQQDMKVLAEGLVETLKNIEADETSQMQHAVVAFGDNVRVVQSPTFKGLRVAEAIYNLPPDPSGIERTFGSVEWCVDRFFSSKWRGGERQNLLILWTDESGDDYLRLENTIARCLGANVRVDVIGPSAVLGARTGYTAFPHPADGITYFLPVHRGPDSGFPQKLSLGYWYRGVPATYDESFRGPYQGTSPRWQGGSNLQSMLSGFSPYALTRLSRETGGRYLMYDRPGDRAPFSLEQIRDYQPDYRSLAEIQFQLQRQPLRQIVLASAARTWSGGNLAQTQPEMTFRPAFGGQPHNEFVRSRLVPMLTREIRTAWQDAQAVEEALLPFLMASALQGFQPRPEVSGHRAPMSESDKIEDHRDQNPQERPKNDLNDKEAMDNDDEEANEELKNIPALSADEVQLATLETELNESLLEQLYQNEPSPRWRAWTDLNMGRLLALSVRLREYLVVSTSTLNNVQNLQSETNFVSFSPSARLQGGPPSEQRLAVARRLLQRCIEENRGTPWQVMAERELRDSFGLEVTQRFVPRPTRIMNTPIAPPPPKPQLPNL
ncbi:MAG: VWA domain-containing protein [Planctomycetaceae bacterium]|nr:VWA domain-containing protein [Planctomycetaceae bacterium]